MRATVKTRRAARIKGIVNEMRAVKILERQGWLVETPNRARFSKLDFFGLWDMMAVGAGRMRWVQVKTNKMPPKAYIKQLKAFKGPGTKELWLFVDGEDEPRVTSF